MALEDVVRIGVHTDGADVTMHLLHAVSSPLTGKIMPFHGPRRAAPLGDARDIDRQDIGKNVDLEFLADLHAVNGRAKFANEPLGFGIRLGDRLNIGSTPLLTLTIETSNVAAFTAAGQTTGLIQKAQLNRLIAIAVGGLHLKDMARARLNHRNGNYVSCGEIKNLRHPDLAAE
jgi:hypothetical protein